MLVTAFILSLWSAVLSAAGFGSQMYYQLHRQPLPQLHAPATHALNPLVLLGFVFVIFLLPVFVSSIFLVRRILQVRKFEPMALAALGLNIFSLLYILFLYGG